MVVGCYEVLKKIGPCAINAVLLCIVTILFHSLRDQLVPAFTQNNQKRGWSDLNRHGLVYGRYSHITNNGSFNNFAKKTGRQSPSHPNFANPVDFTGKNKEKEENPQKYETEQSRMYRRRENNSIIAVHSQKKKNSTTAILNLKHKNKTLNNRYSPSLVW